MAAGDVLFAQGSRGSQIYVVESGRIAIERRRPDQQVELLATLGAGEHFGEMGPLFDLPRSGAARASSASVVVGYTPEQCRVRGGVERLTDLIRTVSDSSSPI